MNDNHPTRDKVQAEMLTTTTLGMSHLTGGLLSMLQANGVESKVLDATKSFIQPFLDRLQSTEALVLAFTREPSPSMLGRILAPAPEQLVVDTFNAVLTRLDAYGKEFSRLSNTTDLTRVADEFREFVGGMTAAFNPDKDVKKGLDLDLD
jgi:hypothetical protein